MEGFRIDLKTFLGWLSLTNTPKVSESKYQAGFGVIILGQNPQTFMIPIYTCSTTVLYDASLDSYRAVKLHSHATFLYAHGSDLRTS